MIKLENTTAYTVQEVAEMLHKTPTTIRKYIRTGELKAKQVGRPYYITEKALEAFIAGDPVEKR